MISCRELDEKTNTTLMFYVEYEATTSSWIAYRSMKTGDSYKTY